MMWRFIFERIGSVESADSSSERISRRLERQAVRRRFVWTGCSMPLSQKRVSTYEQEHDAVVNAQRSRCESVTERDELVGRLSFVDRFPQYLMTYKDKLA